MSEVDTANYEKKEVKENNTSDFVNSYEVLLASHNLGYLYAKTSTVQLNRAGYFKELKKLRNNFITNGIYDIFANEIFSNSKDNGITVQMDNKVLEAEANALVQSDLVITFIKSIFPDLLHYGSYVVKPVFERGSGLVSLEDPFEPGDVIEVMASNGRPLCFFANPIMQDSLGHLPVHHNYKLESKLLSPESLKYLGLNLSYDKIYLGAQTAESFNEFLKKSEEFKFQLPPNVKIKMSTSLLWGNINKLKDLLLLDKLTVLRQTANLLTPTILGVPLPATNSVKEMTMAIDKLDGIVNGQILNPDVINSDGYSVEDLARVKLIPIHGDKSSPQVLETGKTENELDFEKFINQLELFLQSIGIPPELFIGSKDISDKSKIYIRYAKIIKKICKVISNFLTEIIVEHFNYKYPQYRYRKSHVKVTIKTNTNLDILEHTEAQELLLASTRSLVETVETLNKITEKSEYQVDPNAVIDKFNNYLAEVGSPFAGIFVKVNKGTEDDKSREDY